MLYDDIKMAQEIVSRKRKNVTSSPYHNSSFIYRTTNEEISKYQFLLNGRDKVLSVIASGNQILDSIFAGSNDVTGFDISTFPKYLFEFTDSCFTMFFFGRVYEIFLSRC